MKWVIEIENLNIRYGDNWVIKDLNLKIPKNVVFSLMGPSGCGKSTLLRAINRLLDLNENAVVEGTVKVLGRDVYKTDPTWVRKKVGMVFQYPNPFPHMTIYDNVAVGVKLNGMVRNKRELDEIVELSLRRAALWDEVKDRLKDYPGNLSGGQKQRLVIARALAMRSEIILMDEPTANIDPIGTRKLEDLIIDLKREFTVVVVTHSLAQAKRISDYVGFLYLGELVEYGKATEIFERPRNALTERYIAGVLG